MAIVECPHPKRCDGKLQHRSGSKDHAKCIKLQEALSGKPKNRTEPKRDDFKKPSPKKRNEPVFLPDPLLEFGALGPNQILWEKKPKKRSTLPIQGFKFAPTSEQAAVIDAKTSSNHLVIKALAGTGKTQTLLMLATLFGDSEEMAYVAFNASVRSQAKRVFKNRASVFTAHGLALSMLPPEMGKAVKDRALDPKAYKTTWQIAKELKLHDINVPDVHGRVHRLPAQAVVYHAMNAVNGFCMSADAEPSAKHFSPISSLDGCFDDTTPVFGQNNLELANELLPLVVEMWEDMSIAQESPGRFPTNHSVYLKNWSLEAQAGNLEMPFDVVMVDEAQDLNGAMLAGIQAYQDDIQIVMVGDDGQQIYEWMGARNALSKVGNSVVAKLTQSFRFGDSIAAYANYALDDLGAPPGMLLRGNPDKESFVRFSKTEMMNDKGKVVSDRTGDVEWSYPDAILCRSNSGTLGAVIKCQKKELSYYIQGGAKEINRWAWACRNLAAGRGTDHPDLCMFTSLQEAYEHADGMDASDDFVRMIKIIKTHTPRKIIEMIKEAKSQASQADVTITTVHKAKGLEWDHVLLWSDFPGPPDPSDQNNSSGQEDYELDAESKRILYVAATRAMRALDVSLCSYFKNCEPVWSE